MNKVCEHILQRQEIFVGLEDSKKTWALCVRRRELGVWLTAKLLARRHSAWSLSRRAKLGVSCGVEVPVG